MGLSHHFRKPAYMNAMYLHLTAQEQLQTLLPLQSLRLAGVESLLALLRRI